MEKEDSESFKPYSEWSKIQQSNPSFNLFPTGVGGILYPPNSLHKDVTNRELFLKLSPTADDVWFKAMSLMNKTKVISVVCNFEEVQIIVGSQEGSALWKSNVVEFKNDTQIKNVFDYYGLYNSIK